MEKIFPGLFNFHFKVDEGVSSDKLDVTVFKGSPDLTGKLSGMLVHSREQSGTFVEEEPVSFLTYIERAIDC